jgi:hypothetical protein
MRRVVVSAIPSILALMVFTPCLAQAGVVLNCTALNGDNISIEIDDQARTVTLLRGIQIGGTVNPTISAKIYNDKEIRFDLENDGLGRTVLMDVDRYTGKFEEDVVAKNREWKDIGICSKISQQF